MSGSRIVWRRVLDRRPNARPLSGPAYRLRSDGAFNRIVIRSE